jgi:hypothetical protein
MLSLLLSRSLLILTVIAFFALIVALLMMLIRLVEALIERRRAECRGPLEILLLLVGGFVAGLILAWSLVPPAWHLPLLETAYAAGHADIYGHEIEHAAEQILLFVLFGGDLGAIAAAIAAWVIRKRRLRPVVDLQIQALTG